MTTRSLRDLCFDLVYYPGLGGRVTEAQLESIKLERSLPELTRTAAVELFLYPERASAEDAARIRAALLRLYKEGQFSEEDLSGEA